MHEASGELLPLGRHYCVVRRRLAAVVETLSPTEVSTAVPACPGWSVHDVVAHLLGVVEDALAGRIAGPPDEAQTAEEVDRHRGEDTRALLAAWHAAAPAFEEAITAFQIVPALIDVVSHERDILGALGRPAPAADDALALVAAWLAPPTLPVHVVADGRHLGAAGADCTLHTTTVEFVRLRLGRRSREQAIALDWRGDPTPLLDELFVFGPAASDLAE